jgi:hypothetical protein
VHFKDARLHRSGLLVVIVTVIAAIVATAPPRGPPRQLLRPTPPLLSPRVLNSFFLGRVTRPAGGQLGRLDFFASGGTGRCWRTRTRGTPVPTAGLCSVPFLASAPAAGLATGLGSSGFLATMTAFLGVDIMERMAAASASALRRRAS